MASIVSVLLFFSLLIIAGICHDSIGFMDMEELKSVYYGLDILSEPVILNEDIREEGTVYVTSKFGQQYQCSFPDINTEEKKKEEEEKIAIETGIVEMLKPLGLKDCLFKTKDWWSYEFCYGKFIRQFHMEDGEMKGNILYLGYYQEDFDWNNETARDELLRTSSSFNRYHSQKYTLGSKCDLTGQPRKAEVKFMCEENSEDYLSRVDESETCVYTVTVMTSRICRHPYLKAPARRKAVAITCSPLLSEQQFHQYMLEKEELNRKEEELKAAAELREKGTTDPSLDPDFDLDKALEKEMSDMAKELLTQPLDKMFPGTQKEKMSREEFQKMFGDDVRLWELYLQGFEVNQPKVNHDSSRMDRIRQRIQKRRENFELLEAKEEEEEEEEEEVVVDPEDEEIMKEFDDEINYIKESFKQSKSKLSSIKQKLALERSWETEIENAVKEAENELGVKVDRSLISGLSNTLDKLVNKLQDTQSQLTSMDKEIGKMLSKKQKGDAEEETEENAEKDVDTHKADVPGEGEPDLATETATDANDYSEKILAPPKSDLKVTEHSRTTYDPRPMAKEDEVVGSLEDLAEDKEATLGGDGWEDEVRGSTEEAGVDRQAIPAGDEEEGEVEVKIRLTKTGDDDDDVDLPATVHRMLEETVRKERHKTQTGTQPLRFDTDHSFHKEKTVHVIQQEDQDGKTNRFIFIFGLDTTSDASTESQKQRALEDNYNFVYKENKNKKSSEPDS